MVNITFLNRLASARSDADFACTAAGFGVLQVYDSVKSNGFDPFNHQDAIQRIEADIAAIDGAPRLRSGLAAIVQALPFWDSEGSVRVGRQATYAALLIYGQALGDEGDWSIAESVYSIVGLDAELDGETWYAAEARLLMGRASRMCADWESSRIAYQRAYELGLETGDVAISLRARIGEANNLWMRGDLPAARTILQATARKAKKSCPAVLPRVTLAIAGVANAAGEYEEAVHIAFELLASLDDADELVYSTLVDLANFLADYGAPPLAATALRMVERAAPEPRIRRLARINLLFLAAQHESEEEFESCRRALEGEPLPVRETVQFALFSAQGLRRFGRLEEAKAEADRSTELANRSELFQLAFDGEREIVAIEAARKARRISERAPAAAWTPDSAAYVPDANESGMVLSPRMRRVAETLSEFETSRFAATTPEPAPGS